MSPGGNATYPASTEQSTIQRLAENEFGLFHMDLLLESREFTFDRADAYLLAKDWESQLDESTSPPSAQPLKSGRIRQCAIRRPGDYLLICAGLSLTRVLDRRMFFGAEILRAGASRDHGC